jgi:integrase
VTSFDVRMWAIRKNAGRRRPYEVRWVVERRGHSKSFVTRALADGFRAELLSCAHRGSAFDCVSGLPLSLVPTEETSWLSHAQAYVEMKWPRAAAKSRRSMADALATATAALLEQGKEAPSAALMRETLYGWGFNPSRQLDSAPQEVVNALEWMRRASLPISALADAAVARRVLDTLAVTVSGRAAAATTVRRKRAVLYNALRYAVELELLPANPLDRVQWSAPVVARAIDRRVVVNPEQAEALLAAVANQGRRGPHLRAFFGCLYYGGLRPSEALALRLGDCWLPDEGWGRLELAQSSPQAGVAWTNDGAPRELRSLKRRAQREVRRVPVPPELVALLRSHVDKFGTGPSGRLFRSERGGSLQETAYGTVWRKARLAALTSTQAASPLAARPYDLRHAAVSLWLNAGVPATEVAARAGHSVAVLLSVYAGCLDGEEGVANDRISAALTHARLTRAQDRSQAAMGSSAGQLRDA